MELFTATVKLKKIFFGQLDGRTVHTHTTGSKLRCHTLTKHMIKYL